MTDEALRRLLTEHLPPPPPAMAEPPLAAIRGRARRRAGTQVALAAVAVAVIGTGTAVWATGDTAGAPATGSSGVADRPPVTSTSAGMLTPTYLPPGYGEDTGSENELRFADPTGQPPIPLVIRREPADSQPAAEGPPLRSATVRGQRADVFLIENGGLALNWIEDGSRYSVVFEAPPDTQIDFDVDETVTVLAAVAESLSR